MTTRRSVLLTGLGMLCAPLQRAHASEPANLLAAAEVHVAGYPTVEAIRWIGETMARESQGRWALRLYDAGQLGRESDAADLARFGALDLVRLSLGALNNAFPATRVLSLPYSFDSVAHMRRCVDGAIGDAILESFASRGLVGLAFYDSGARCFYNARRPLLVPADLAGMKIRVPPSDIFIATAQAFGANPTPLSYGETFSALQTHLIDGAENNWPSFHGSRHFEVARYWSQTLHSCSPDVLLMSQRRWDAMADDDRQLLRRIARESIQVARTLWDAREAESRAAAVAAGVQVGEVNQAAFRAAVAPLLAEYRRDPALDRQWRAIRDQA
jgi:tripartite ATP-independent transporter DctP family solute receptor